MISNLLEGLQLLDLFGVWLIVIEYMYLSGNDIGQVNF